MAKRESTPSVIPERGTGFHIQQKKPEVRTCRLGTCCRTFIPTQPNHVYCTVQCQVDDSSARKRARDAKRRAKR